MYDLIYQNIRSFNTCIIFRLRSTSFRGNNKCLATRKLSFDRVYCVSTCHSDGILCGSNYMYIIPERYVVYKYSPYQGLWVL